MSNSTPALADGQAVQTVDSTPYIEQGIQCRVDAFSLVMGVPAPDRRRPRLPQPCKNGRWSVYKLYDADARLLYVGHSMQVARRLHEHEQSKSWWTDVAFTKIERFDSVKDARAVEKHAIVCLCPLHNKQHNIARQLNPDRKPVNAGWINA